MTHWYRLVDQPPPLTVRVRVNWSGRVFVAVRGRHPFRHSWRDLSGVWTDEQSRSMWWGIILDQALQDVKRSARQFETMDGAERDRRITAQARRGR